MKSVVGSRYFVFVVLGILFLIGLWVSWQLFSDLQEAKNLNQSLLRSTGGYFLQIGL